MCGRLIVVCGFVPSNAEVAKKANEREKGGAPASIDVPHPGVSSQRRATQPGRVTPVGEDGAGTTT